MADGEKAKKEPVQCERCKRWFKNSAGYKNHIKFSKNPCDSIPEVVKETKVESTVTLVLTQKFYANLNKIYLSHLAENESARLRYRVKKNLPIEDSEKEFSDLSEFIRAQ